MRKRLGELLVEAGIITKEQLKKAISYQKEHGLRLGEALIQLEIISEGKMIKALGKQLGIPYYSFEEGRLSPAKDQELDKLVPYDFAIKHVVLPLSRELTTLTVAVFDPTDLIVIDNLQRITGCEIKVVISTKKDILRAINKFYGELNIIKNAMKRTYEDTEEADITIETGKEKTEEISLNRLVAEAEEAPVVKLVDLIIRQAIQQGASDIHIEPFHNRLSLRYRIDGVLYEVPPPSFTLHLALVSRIKILSHMDIAEKRLPQDGSFTVRTENKIVDLRVSTLPTIHGEKVVIRILDKERVPLQLAQLGFLPAELEVVKKGISFPYGLIFLTGPTGSGKSTTLYATLNELRSSAKNIITVEDPVEYKIDGVNQVRVDTEIGLTFAQAMRAFLRQDPDIILVGEVRDLETAEMCLRASLTGHLVLSTLHTNDAASAVNRLIDLGIPRYLVASSLRLIIAQRLVRKLCISCKEARELREEERKNIGINTNIVYQAKGCDKCSYIGYKGRTIVVEAILIDDEIRELIYQKASASELMDLAKSKGTLSLFESGLRRVEEGITSLEEVMSVTATI